MGDVIGFPRTGPLDAIAALAEESTLSGRAACLECDKLWVAVAPAGTWELECPDCKKLSGRWNGLVGNTAGEYLVCGCSGMLFYLRRKDGDHLLECATCGGAQRF